MKLSSSVLSLIFIWVAQVQGDRTDCRHCKPGHYAKRHCNEFHDTICAQCPEGTYTPKSNIRELCFTCSTCSQGFFVIKSCTTLHDTVCGSCSEKKYSELSTYRADCVPYRKVAQKDEPSEESTTEESIDLGSGDGELIIHHESVHPTVIDDVIPEKEANRVTNGSQVRNETLDDEGSGEGFPIVVPPEEEFETTSTDHNLTFSTTESLPTSHQPPIVTSVSTPLPETFNTTVQETTSTTLEPSLNATDDETSSAKEEPISTTPILEQSSIATTTTPNSTSTSEPSTTTVVIQPIEITPTPTTPEPTSESSSMAPVTTTSTTTLPPTTQSTTTQSTTSQSTTTQATTTTTTQPTTTTAAATTTTTTAHTTQEPTTAKSKTLQYTDKDGMVIIDMRGSTIIDLRTTPTPRPKSKTTTVKTIDLDSENNGIIIDMGKQEEESIDLPDYNLPDSKTDTDSSAKTGALGSQKMDENDGVTVGVVVAVVIVAAIIFFVVGFLVSRYCRKKRSGSFKVKNDIENGSVKGSTAAALEQHKDGGIYDEIGQETVTPAKNGKPNGKAHSTEDVYAVPDKRKSNPPASPKLDDQVIKFIDDTDEDLESKEGDKLLEDSDEKYSSFASIPNGSVKQNGDVTSNDYVSESSPMLSSRDTPKTPEVSEDVRNDKEAEDADLEASPLLENSEAEDSQPAKSS